jgi:KaiC/GvpD/RAD55 family RecA-like ATPase
MTNKNTNLKMVNIGDLPRTTELAERFMYPFSQLNFLLNGGIFGRVVMVAAPTDNGKSTLVSQILNSVIEQDYKVGAFFGEDSTLEARDRIYKQATSYSSDNIYYKPYEQNGKQTNTGEYIISEKAFEIAQKKFDGKFFLFPIDFGAEVDKILGAFDDLIKEHGVKVFVLDNADQFEFASDNENKAMRDIQIKIRNFAISRNVLIFLVAHTRKLERNVILPDLNDIKGTSALVNIARDIMILIRTDKIDRTTKEYSNLVKLLKHNNYDIEEKDKDGNYKVDAILRVAKTKGRKLGFVCLGFNRISQTYYEVKKIDEAKVESDRSNVVVENVQLLEIPEQEMLDLPF